MKFFADIDFGYSTRFDEGFSPVFGARCISIDRLEIVNQKDPETRFRFLYATDPVFVTGFLTSMDGTETKDNFLDTCGGDKQKYEGFPCGGTLPIMTVETKGPKDFDREVHMRVTFKMKGDDALELVKKLILRDRSPFIRKAAFWDGREWKDLKCPCRPPATCGQFYPSDDPEKEPMVDKVCIFIPQGC